MKFKINYFLSTIALSLAVILGYWLYDISADANARWVTATGGFVCFASMIVPLIGVAFDNSRVAASVKAASILFLVILLIVNFSFAVLGVRIPLYVIVTALILLVGLTVIYKLSQMDDL